MCTVSFVNINGTIILTSNRDEKTIRPAAIAPKNYRINHKNVFFPKDKKGGGTWFAVNENAAVLILLNGAAEKHVPKSSYRKSRGLIVLELISKTSVISAWHDLDLENIEPFTLVLYENENLYQLQWNDVEKSTIKLDDTKSHIWSSSTLYSSEIRKERANWFKDFLANNEELTAEKLSDFHTNTKKENTDYGLVINRNNEMQTLSVTQTVIDKNKVKISYNDLIADKVVTNAFITI